MSALERALREHDADGVEDALLSAGEGDVPALIALLEAPWHFKHEDIVSLLQKLRPPEAVAALERAALIRHTYLDYDVRFALARKCTWALADIGTDEAKAALRRLTQSKNRYVLLYALRRLHAWGGRELKRKRG